MRELKQAYFSYAISIRNYRVTNADFMRSAINAKREEGQEINLMQFIKKLDKQMDFLDIDKDMAQRYLNEGFSGGEKTK